MGDGGITILLFSRIAVLDSVSRGLKIPMTLHPCDRASHELSTIHLGNSCESVRVDSISSILIVLDVIVCVSCLG